MSGVRESGEACEQLSTIFSVDLISECLISDCPCENRNSTAQLRKGTETLTEESLLLKNRGEL